MRAFADGEDNCRPIQLNVEQLRWIAKVLRGEDSEYELPSNEDVIRGAFFGDEEWWDELRRRRFEDAETFDKAADWVDSDQQDDKYWHEYQASW